MNTNVNEALLNIKIKTDMGYFMKHVNYVFRIKTR